MRQFQNPTDEDAACGPFIYHGINIIMKPIINAKMRADDFCCFIVSPCEFCLTIREWPFHFMEGRFKLHVQHLDRSHPS